MPALFSLDARLRPQPDLVAAMPRPGDFSDDPFSVRLRLRAARWNDGQPITSRDVRFSWEKLRDGPTGYRYRFLRDVRIEDARALTLLFDRPVRRWWSLFSIDDMVLPAHAYSDDWSKRPTVSGGPFAVDSWTEGLRVRLVRNERYWRPVALARIDVLFVPDDETRLQLLELGRLDAAFAEGETNIGRRSRAHGFPPVDGALKGEAGASGAFGPTWWELALDPRRTGENVAAAVIEAVDPRLAAEILEDSARTMDLIPARFATPHTGSRVWRDRGSVSEARGHLGDLKGAFQLAFARNSTAAAIATFIHFRLKDVGISVELVGLESDTFERAWVPERRAPVFLRLRRGADAPDAASYTAAAQLPGGAPVDDDVAAAEIAPAATTRAVVGLDATAWQRAQEDLLAARTIAPLAHTRSWIIGRAGVFGPHVVGAANGPLWNVAAWSVSRS